MNAFRIACISVALVALVSQSVQGAEWSYSGEDGPQHWGDLAPEFELCGTGIAQSPIELDQANATGDLEVSVDWSRGPLAVSNQGKTVQVDFPEGSYMTSGGKVFELLQVHFHTPSEHTYRGEAYPLVAHFVHASHDGALGVLGVFFEEGGADGGANEELTKIIEAVPAQPSDPVVFDGVIFDPNGMLPDELEIWRYMGSLTTPPCSEGVHWHVVEDTVSASASQIRALEKLMGNNVRPVLPLNDRLLVKPE